MSQILFRRYGIRAFALASLAALGVAGAAPAHAEGWRHDRGWHHDHFRHDHVGVFVGPGYGYGYAPPPVAYAPAPVYAPPPVVYGPSVNLGFRFGR
jgi:hypothetical protein